MRLHIYIQYCIHKNCDGLFFLRKKTIEKIQKKYTFLIKFTNLKFCGTKLFGRVEIFDYELELKIEKKTHKKPIFYALFNFFDHLMCTVVNVRTIS